MNISIPYSWIKDYIKTDAKAEDIARILSLHSFSVDKIIKAGGDEIFEIEVTPNRGDALSVLGIARELKVLLPRQGFKCEWLKKEYEEPKNLDVQDNIEVVIKDKTLVPRFSAVIMDNVKFVESPKLIRERLENVGIRPLGNVIDVTNYMMIDKGQPMHVFDYEKILGSKMIVRESTEGEVISTLDGIDRKLPSGVIVIEDEDGRLIDLCGIMGAKNSEVDENTKKILLFVQVYDPVKIRKASMSLGHRTDAALRFEKGIDYEGVIPALWESVEMISKLSGAKLSSGLIDIVNYERDPKEIHIDFQKINKLAGIEIENQKVSSILSDLGFEKVGDGNVMVPSWRYEDINIIEDLAEEVIRIYGYYNLPAKLPSGEIPVREIDKTFYWEKVVRYFLKYVGFFECYTYSATDKENVDENALNLSNPLNEDMTHLKTSLLPQLLDVVNKNQGYSEKIKIFEIGSVYLLSGLNSEDKIPDQPLRLGIVTKGIDYNELKGILKGMFDTLGIKYGLEESLGIKYEIKEYGGERLGVEFNFDDLVQKATKVRAYKPLTSFNSIKEDLTFEIPQGVLYPQIEKIILETDKRIFKLEFKDIYKNYLTFSIEYLDDEKQISSEDTQEIRKKIFKNLEKLGVKLKI
ncbi:phenylalanine--tRNA ligase subunit beta [Patescibacteria group bacterium]|nr:phenylalanine--tRNA ligase subunit beta [Patescibacteria group bacterium]